MEPAASTPVAWEETLLPAASEPAFAIVQKSATPLLTKERCGAFIGALA